MVRVQMMNGRKFFICEACNMYYLEREWAEKCEKSCIEKKCCDTEVMKHSIEVGEN